MSERQSQKAGANAQQIQVFGNLVVQSIDEDRAKEIARAAALEVVAEYAEESHSVAIARMQSFDDELIRELSSKNLLEAFRDPSFQVALRKAQIGAASTERESDYMLLARLLADRAQRDVRPVKASIDRAVQVVDLLDDDALTGLSMAFAVQRLFPAAGMVAPGLDTLERLLAQLLTATLPEGDDWLDHLDTLDAARLATAGIPTLKKLGDYYSEAMPGYTCVGMSEEEMSAVQERISGITSVRVPIVDHELKDGFKRFPFVDADSVDKALDATAQLSEEQRRELAEVIFGMGHFKEVDAGCTAALVEQLDARPSLRVIRKWWDDIPNAFNITGVGKVIAQANIRLLDETGKMQPIL